MDQIKGMLHYLNTAMRPEGSRDLTADVELVDSSGEVIGHMTYNGVDQYVFMPGPAR